MGRGLLRPASGKGLSPKLGLSSSFVQHVYSGETPAIVEARELPLFAFETTREDDVTINRTQALVLGFFLLVWASLVAIFLAVPEVYYRAMKLSSAGAGLLFLVGISAFISLLGIGVLRRWRWTFWLIAIAFLFGVLRIPVTFLTLAGVLPADGPPWYVVYQGFLGLVQFAIALFMLAGYRRVGTWGAF